MRGKTSKLVQRLVAAAAGSAVVVGGVMVGLSATASPTHPPLETHSETFRGEKAISAKAEALSSSLNLGKARSAVTCEAEYGPCVQEFEKGDVRWSRETGAIAAPTTMMEWWKNHGDVTGPLGLPDGDADCTLPEGGCQWRFATTFVVQDPNGAILTADGAIGQHWASEGGARGILGYPTGEMSCGLAAGGCTQEFAGGTVYWSSTTGAHVIGSHVAAYWKEHGAEAGEYGYPAGAEECSLPGGGCSQKFEKGTISLKEDGTPHAAIPEIIEYWNANGGESGKYGAAVGEPTCREGAAGKQCIQQFANGEIKWREGVGVIDCTQLQCAALTFDDGPGEHTSRLLDILQEKNVDATFFIIGASIKVAPEVVQRTASLQMQIANHSWNHPSFLTIPDDQIRSQIARTNDRLVEVTGIKPHLMRPPYGARNGHVKGIIESMGLRETLWDVDTRDWQHRDPAKTIEITLNKVKPGDIILMHDVHSPTVDAVAPLIDELHELGYTLVTVDDLGR